MFDRLQLARRARAAGWHLLLSTGVAALAAALVFGLWYPGPYRHLSGGNGLFILVVTVDVILGPLLTFAVFNLAKGWPHLRRDLSVIGLIQLAGLAYGLHTVYAVRPVAAVFEVDRIRVVSASEVYLPELPQAEQRYRSLPLTGPWLLSTRASRPGEERSRAIFMALDGIDVGQRPSFWQPYAAARADALGRARPLGVLLERYPARAADIRAAVDALALPVAEARFLPVMARGDWVAVLDAKGDIATFVAADGFF